jgi:CHAT domain-containing protein
MSALFDDRTSRYLIEQYAIGVAPALSLVDLRFARKSQTERYLFLGMTEASSNFPALPYVEAELSMIRVAVGNGAQVDKLMDGSFTFANVEHALSSSQYGRLHIASHAHLGANSDESFVLFKDRRVLLDDVDSLIRSGRTRSDPIDLVVLTSCQTASGDENGALGLYGLHTKLAARSAIGTLWSVGGEEGTTIVSQFYQNLVSKDLVSKAEALRKAQITTIHDASLARRHPYYWAPFLLAGDWR